MLVLPQPVSIELAALVSRPEAPSGDGDYCGMVQVMVEDGGRLGTSPTSLLQSSSGRLLAIFVERVL
jgi:hypothetical protein